MSRRAHPADPPNARGGSRRGRTAHARHHPRGGTALVDASAGFGDNEALATELLGFRPARHAPLGADATLYAPDPSDEDDED